jgi:hypothetical protein
LILNVGPSRADGLPGIEKIDIASGGIMKEIVKTVMYGFSSSIYHFRIDGGVSVGSVHPRMR